jgi:hypothetical protein
MGRQRSHKLANRFGWLSLSLVHRLVRRSLRFCDLSVVVLILEVIEQFLVFVGVSMDHVTKCRCLSQDSVMSKALDTQHDRQMVGLRTAYCRRSTKQSTCVLS